MSPMGLENPWWKQVSKFYSDSLKAKVKNFPVVQQRLFEWYEIESQFREIGSSEILERGRYLASVLDVAPSKITDYFVSNWQRKYNILLTESPVYAKRIREKKDFEESGIIFFRLFPWE